MSSMLFDAESYVVQYASVIALKLSYDNNRLLKY